MEHPLRFFVSFSSRDGKHVREIMAALKGQELDVWDYSDIAKSIELGEVIFDRLINEIDQCTHMLVVISENSLDPEIGRFCRMEVEHALKRHLTHGLILLPVLIDGNDKLKIDGPYKELEKSLYYDFKITPESIVALTVKVCQVAGKVYIPLIVAHPNLPFRELFRKELIGLDTSNKNYTDLMIILGQFNEYYRLEVQDIERAFKLIKHFISSCDYLMNDYHPFYPWIVKAVCETELKMFDEAMKSYEVAKTIHPENENVIGGIGSIYFEMHQYSKATDCFEQIIRNNVSEDLSYARINLIITKQHMGNMLSAEEEKFLSSVNIEAFADDLKIRVLNTQAVQYTIKKNYSALEDHCLTIIKKDLYDTYTIRLLQLSFLNRGMMECAKHIKNKALKEADHNPRLDKSILETF